MNYIQVVFTAIFSAVFLFALTKLMGDKQLSQLSFFDYITGITIGSIAAEMATELEDPIKPLIAMIVYALLDIIISYAILKNLFMRKILIGRPILIMDNGVIYRKNLGKAKLDINEFMMLCRTKGFFNLSDIQTAVLESNGSISFLPISDKRPLNSMDMNIKPKQEYPVTNVILDGHILNSNLLLTGNNVLWLEEQIKKQGYDSAEDIFLATCDNDNNLSIYPLNNKLMKIDWFE